MNDESIVSRDLLKTMESPRGRQIRHTINIPVGEFDYDEIVITDGVTDLNVFYADDVKLTLPESAFNINTEYSKITELNLSTHLYRGKIRSDTKIVNEDDIPEITKEQSSNGWRPTADLEFVTESSLDMVRLQGCWICMGEVTKEIVHICAKTPEHHSFEVGERLIILK